MIKVNLNKTKSSAIHTQTEGMTSAADTIFTNIKNAIKAKEIDIHPIVFVKITFNLILILCFPLGLKIYEISQIKQLSLEKQSAQKALEEEKRTLAQLEADLGAYSHLQDKSKEFAEKKDFLKHLAEERLIIPRTIDLIQNKVPKTVWLESLRLSLSGDGSEVSIMGKGFNEDYVNSFAGALHDILDKNTITVNTRDIKEGDSIVKVDFDLKGSM